MSLVIKAMLSWFLLSLTNQITSSLKEPRHCQPALLLMGFSTSVVSGYIQEEDDRLEGAAEPQPPDRMAIPRMTRAQGQAPDPPYPLLLSKVQLLSWRQRERRKGKTLEVSKGLLGLAGYNEEATQRHSETLLNQALLLPFRKSLLYRVKGRKNLFFFLFKTITTTTFEHCEGKGTGQGFF